MKIDETLLLPPLFFCIASTRVPAANGLPHQDSQATMPLPRSSIVLAFIVAFSNDSDTGCTDCESQVMLRWVSIYTVISLIAPSA
jgi:hypothetical protein